MYRETSAGVNMDVWQNGLVALSAETCPVLAGMAAQRDSYSLTRVSGVECVLVQRQHFLEAQFQAVVLTNHGGAGLAHVSVLFRILENLKS